MNYSELCNIFEDILAFFKIEFVREGKLLFTYKFEIIDKYYPIFMNIIDIYDDLFEFYEISHDSGIRKFRFLLLHAK